ncbi:MAG: alpha/beta fold hydrolase [Actinomycetota bacterium]
MESLQLADGRSLEFCRTGPVDPSAWLIFHIGTPSAAALFPHVTEVADARGIATASYSRAGYGGSTRSEGRTVAQEAVNAAALADHLGASTFFVAGWSGGGPGALACAALLPERVRSCVVFAGNSPVEEVELSGTSGSRRTTERNSGPWRPDPRRRSARSTRKPRRSSPR